MISNWWNQLKYSGLAWLEILTPRSTEENISMNTDKMNSYFKKSGWFTVGTWMLWFLHENLWKEALFLKDIMNATVDYQSEFKDLLKAAKFTEFFKPLPKTTITPDFNW